ncbi:hypothetical protein D3C87_1363580 [compost metagenome]
MSLQAQALTGARGQFQLVDGPCRARLRLPAQMLWREVVEQRVERRMHRHQLALQMGRQFADLDTSLGADGF